MSIQHLSALVLFLFCIASLGVGCGCGDDDNDTTDDDDDTGDDDDAVDDDSGDDDTGDDDTGDDDDDAALPRLIGEWSGEAQTPDGEFLLPGEFPVTMFIVQSGSQVRGFLDLHQDVALLAEAFTYFFTGELAEGGALSLTMTDRMCGAGEPEGLCYPAFPLVLPEVFTAEAVADSASLSFDAAEELPDIGYETDLPFTQMTLSRSDVLGADTATSLANAWTGPCRIPTSVLYPLPLPLYGQNEMVIEENGEGGIVIAQFDNEFLGNVVPDFDDIILADTLIFESVTGRFAFIQLGTVYASWLYTGVLTGNQLSVLVAFNSFDAPYYDYLGDQTTPPDPLSVSVLDFAGVCTFTKTQ